MLPFMLPKVMCIVMSFLASHLNVKFHFRKGKLKKYSFLSLCNSVNQV